MLITMNLFQFTLVPMCFNLCVLAKPTAHVFLLPGQSNVMGYNTDGPTAEDVTYPNILQFTRCSRSKTRCKLILADDPLQHNCTRAYLTSQNIGFGMTFAREFRADLPENDIIVLIPAGIGNSGFIDSVWTAYNGTGFVKAQRYLHKTFELLEKDYPQCNVVFDGILWHQGEKDADVGTSTDDYLYKDLIPMIEAWRDPKVQAKNKNVPFVVGNLLPSWGQDSKNPQRRGVVIAIQLVNQYCPFTGLASSQGLVGDVSEGADVVHFSAKSQRILGKRYYVAWKAAKLNNG